MKLYLFGVLISFIGITCVSYMMFIEKTSAMVRYCCDSEFCRLSQKDSCYYYLKQLLLMCRYDDFYRCKSVDLCESSVFFGCLEKIRKN